MGRVRITPLLRARKDHASLPQLKGRCHAPPLEAIAGDGSTRAATGAWVAAQLDEPASLHREYYRKRANARTPQAVVTGAVRQACDVSSRWHRHAFTRADTGKTIEMAYVDGTYTLSLDGVARSETTSFNDSAYLSPYLICDDVGESVGGDVYYGTNCDGLLANPAVAFASFDRTIANATFKPLRGRKYNDENPLRDDVALLVDAPAGCDDGDYPASATSFMRDADDAGTHSRARARACGGTREGKLPRTRREVPRE